ncbi:nucleotidyltransferase domain-containing protein [Halobacillus sp. B29]|uniref:nucleotidyltransferase domain-containing protein n=1 Tax=Halobacillus sp. B29 TaxID=3457432 RepID=UPI003FCD6699
MNLDLSEVPKELRLIIELLKAENHTDIRNIQSEWYQGIDWKLFVKQAFHHRVYPILHSKAVMVEERFMPASVIERLSFEYKRNTFQMLQLSAEMQHIGHLFTKNGLRTLFLKGPMLAQELYGDVSLRTSGDLDLLIPIDRLEKAEALLEKQGYVKDDYIQTVLNDWKWRHHHVTYFHPKKNIKIELHWRLNPGPGKEPHFESLWSRKTKCSITKYPIYMLGAEDLFLFLVSHGARHGWSRLRWLFDIHQLMKQELNWAQVNKLLKKYHFQEEGAQACILSSELLASPIYKEMKLTRKSKKLAQQAVYYFEFMINLHSLPLPEEVAIYHKRHLFALMSLSQKVIFILSFLHPYPEDAQLLPLPKRLHFLYFPLRPFLWGWRKTRKHVLA